MDAEFDYQWEKLPDVNLEYTEDRITEFLSFTDKEADFFAGKSCLDAGCGIGRYTFAMKCLKADVTSIDISEKAIEQCKKINKKSYVKGACPIKDLNHKPTCFSRFQGLIEH